MNYSLMPETVSVGTAKDIWELTLLLRTAIGDQSAKFRYVDCVVGGPQSIRMLSIDRVRGFTLTQPLNRHLDPHDAAREFFSEYFMREARFPLPENATSTMRKGFEVRTATHKNKLMVFVIATWVETKPAIEPAGQDTNSVQEYKAMMDDGAYYDPFCT